MNLTEPSSPLPRRSREFSFALKTTMPVFLGYLAIGIAFGLMSAGAGLPWFIALAMSLLMYAGAGQYLAVGMFSRGATLWEMAVLTLMVNARHMVYGLSLIDRFRQWPKARPYLIFSLTDETYALLTSLQVPRELNAGKVNLLVAAMDQAWWVLGSMIGVLAGTLLPIPTDGLDFALTALFAVLVVERWKEGAERLSFFVGLGTSLAAALVFGLANMLLPAILLGIAVLLVVPPRRTGQAAPDSPAEAVVSVSPDKKEGANP